jgi:small conductance mechanosensitive channel
MNQRLGAFLRAKEAAADSSMSSYQWSELFHWQAVLPNLLQAVVIGAISLASYRVIKLATNRLLERDVEEEDFIVKRNREQRARTLASLLNNIAAVFITVVALLTILTVLGLKIGPILATAGVAGLAISFGAQSLVRDVINGIFILVEGHFGIGDVIRVGETAGQVEKMTLRATVLRDNEGVVHILPNGEIARVSNLTKAWSRSMLDLRVSYKEDIDRVIAVLGEIGREISEDPRWESLLIGEPEILGVQNLTESAVVIRMTTKTLPLKQWEVGRELRRRIKKRFDEERIEIPFPHVTMYWGRDQMMEGASNGPRDGAELGANMTHDAAPAIGSKNP